MTNSYVEPAIKGAGVTSASMLGAGWVWSIDWIALIGCAILVLTFIMNFIFRRRDDKRKQEIHDLAMAKARKELEA
ncbi:MAG: hypothetical protein GOVbin4685_21 [Prokaryotic dsDNA virus sp.]|jgi:hypothetical protein|nr:MAG: hypothetical protein GOVbin4685_21 [Prokaryotic dsDNA virus sp.]|tara:strand:- start:2047 stop:2274 length:228 start_codon:yes stop_codon:yes gene_type:complete